MIKDIQTAISFTNLSPMRRDRLSALLSGADRAWTVYDNTLCRNRITGTSSYHAVDAQKAAARLLRIGRR